jgi:formate/nitrite transporter FocA (FNT family)
MPCTVYAQAEMAEFVSRTGVVKGNMRLKKGFFSSVSAGCLLSFACVTLNSTMSSPWYQGNVPGLIRMLSALVIPYGLSMGFLTGASLYTDSFMVSSQICVPQMPNE